MDACNISGLNLQCHILSSKKRRAELARNVYSAFCTDGLRGWSHHTLECRETALPQAAWLSSRSPVRYSYIARASKLPTVPGAPRISFYRQATTVHAWEVCTGCTATFDMRSRAPRAVTYIEKSWNLIGHKHSCALAPTLGNP